MSCTHLASSMNEDSSSRRQLPRTNECAKCHQPIGSRCSTETSSPIAPESSKRCNARLYGAYRITWHTAKVAPARSAASTMSSHCSGVVAMGFSSSRCSRG
jgi:hypothetical protein